MEMRQNRVSFFCTFAAISEMISLFFLLQLIMYKYGKDKRQHNDGESSAQEAGPLGEGNDENVGGYRLLRVSSSWQT
jgi:hypothetical protein